MGACAGTSGVSGEGLFSGGSLNLSLVKVDGTGQWSGLLLDSELLQVVVLSWIQELPREES